MFFKIVVYDEIKTIDELHRAILFHAAAAAAVVVGAVAAVATVAAVVVVAARVLFMAANYQISSESQKRRRKLCFLAKSLNEHFQTATHIFLSALKEERFFSSKGLNQRADYVIIIAIVELITESRGAEGGG